MNATTTNHIALAEFVPASDTEAPTDYIRLAQNSFLTELPGLIIGLVTLVYIVGSFLALA